jgi:hypothetical protein
MIEEHAEFKDLYQGLVTRSEEIAADLRDLQRIIDLPSDIRILIRKSMKSINGMKREKGNYSVMNERNGK